MKFYLIMLMCTFSFAMFNVHGMEEITEKKSSISARALKERCLKNQAKFSENSIVKRSRRTTWRNQPDADDFDSPEKEESRQGQGLTPEEAKFVTNLVRSLRENREKASRNESQQEPQPDTELEEIPGAHDAKEIVEEVLHEVLDEDQAIPADANEDPIQQPQQAQWCSMIPIPQRIRSLSWWATRKVMVFCCGDF